MTGQSNVDLRYLNACRKWCLRQLKTMPYKDYLLTPSWQRVRSQVLMLSGNKCQVCKATGVELHVHHKTYERRGEELPEDLIVLCKDCHAKHHDKEDA
jgi:5-methylcytosine-specific restriction endonuclease McrA